MADTPPALPSGPKQFPCDQCGAMLFWDPGTASLKCPYCGAVNALTADAADDLAPPPVQRELDYLAYLDEQSRSADTVETTTVRCEGCGAEQTLREGQTAATCVFCGKAIVTQATVRRLIKPQSVLPFKVTRDQAGAAFKTWLASRWFAPSSLKLLAERNGIQGVYVPAWTYDSQTDTQYTGQRGDNYWETVTYTETVNGQSVTKTRQEMRTRWSPAWGRVHNAFDDVLVLAMRSLPKRADALEPWDLPALVAYDDRYLSGFVAESYTVDLGEGFGVAKQKMQPTIDTTIRHDIGGDQQRIDSADTSYYDITFKHVLLPMWISAYRYQGQVYNFLVNARTGEVQGDRPWSAWKIAGLVLAIVALIAIIVLLANRHR